MDAEVFRNLKIGDKIKVVDKLINQRCGIAGGMKIFEGKLVTVRKNNNILYSDAGITYSKDLVSLNIFEDDGFYRWSEDCFENEIFGSARSEKETRTYTDFKVGDLIKIRSYDDMAKSYGVYDDAIMTIHHRFSKRMKKFSGLNAIVKRIKEDEVILRFLHMKSKEYNNYHFTTEMIELVEENYLEKISKNKKMRKPRKMTDEDIINEMISKVDIEKLKKILASVLRIKGSQLKGIEPMLKKWAISKKDIYILFGKNLKLDKDIEYIADDNEWQANLKELGKKYPALYLFLNDIPIRFFSSGIYKPFSSLWDELMPNAKDGMKLSTFVSQAVKNPEFDIEFSKLIDSSKVKGKIVLSIDPVDFLLMSFNQSGWTSCHTISKYGGSFEFGEYAGGIFSYIADSTTIISYRHSNKLYDYNLGTSKFKEYSKNWRELIYIDTKNYVFCASRQYPRYDETISKSVREFLEKIITDKLKIENQWKVVSFESSSFANKYIDDCEYPLHYNDMLNGFKGKFVYNKILNNFELAQMKVGDSPICPICGENYICESHHITCSECD